jgi:hypothetical protein
MLYFIASTLCSVLKYVKGEPLAGYYTILLERKIIEHVTMGAVNSLKYR